MLIWFVVVWMPGSGALVDAVVGNASFSESQSHQQGNVWVDLIVVVSW
jgi:hypothetical protein